MINDIEDFIQKSADKNGWALQPDETLLKTVKERQVKNLKTYGYYLCPCREGWENRFKDRDIICPCDYAEEDIKELGNCCCSLFFSKEAAAAGKPPQSIPDRRPEEKYPD